VLHDRNDFVSVESALFALRLADNLYGGTAPVE
jgi:hypothetical protein